RRNLAGRGCLTVKFNFPYAQAGRKAPDRAPVLEHTWRAVFERVRTDAQCAGGRIYLSGKSLGGRMASHIAADTATAPRSLIFFGFPLHPPNHRDTQRAAPLFGIETPMLFIQGTRDPFCDLELLKSVLARLKAPHRLHVIDDGDHSFKLPKRAQRSEKSVWDEIVAAADDWMTYSATRGGG
ncbi:MAG: dienelactone hydrolase family protein, partial [Gammaproteobacteria bacterium]|nr:dienelactone hydrolase family protein [Gammaproteobacteria bacterium]